MNNFESILNKAKGAKLAESERTLLRTRIENFMVSHPLGVSGASSSNFAWFTFLYQHATLVTVVIVLFFVGTLSLLAEGAIPGDVLYGVKTGVNEKVLGLFATSPDAKAEWQLSLADRRLGEIATLSKEKKLTPAIKNELQADVDLHTTLALGTSTATLSANDGVSTDAHVFVTASTSTAMRLTGKREETPSSLFQASASTTISASDISTLEANIVSRKQNVNNQKPELKRAKTFIRNKAASLVAEKLTLEASDARRSGDNAEAQRLVGEAQAVLSHNPLPEDELKAETPLTSATTSVDVNAPGL